MYDFDVVVVGGGVYGAAVLHSLARKGIHRTLLVEGRTLSSGSTGKSAAMIRVYHRDPFLTDLALSSFDTFKELESSGRFVRTGALFFESMDRLPDVHRQVERLKAKGYRIEIIGRWEAESRCPGIRWPHRSFAVWEPDAGYADPVETTRGWIQQAKRMGAKIMENCPLEKIISDGDRILGVRTESGNIRAKRVVLASGTGTAALLDDLGVTHALASRWIQFHQFQGSGQLSPPSFYNGLDGSFGRPVGKHGAMIGVSCPDGGGTRELNQLQVMQSQMVAGQTVRGLEQSHMSGAVRARDAYTPDGRAWMGAVPNLRGLFVATGGSGAGFRSAPAVGARVAYSVLRSR